MEITKGREKKRTTGIYIIQVFNYIYIGQAINIDRRIKEHIKKKNKQHIDYLMNKYEYKIIKITCKR